MSSAPVPTLAYWEGRARAQPIRNLLIYSGVKFTDKRYQSAERKAWQSDKSTLGLDFPNLPYYIDGDLKLSQSTAILRYLGRKYGLVATDDRQRALQDMAEQQILDMREIFLKLIARAEDPAVKHDDYITTILKPQLDLLVKFLADKQWLIGGQLSYVDFIVYEVMDWLRRFTPETIGKYATIGQYLDRFEALPAIKVYQSSGEYKPWPAFAPHFKWRGI
ncbi:unnamed protein product [Medioppia subpectinata]|uniref:glutathione transferase n=1 Tax=Medioppia subpectinata TaxID=1979941 RepID=A0A7R9PWC8_9ACAR|nr:unnamed protein product [Medioppia subpectinata]CAG2103198.1 unnamed protein product [Medioppia subpectinata]